jgi:hypothetical protein
MTLNALSFLGLNSVGIQRKWIGGGDPTSHLVSPPWQPRNLHSAAVRLFPGSAHCSRRISDSQTAAITRRSWSGATCQRGHHPGHPAGQYCAMHERCLAGCESPRCCRNNRAVSAGHSDRQRCGPRRCHVAFAFLNSGGEDRIRNSRQRHGDTALKIGSTNGHL